MFSHEFFLDLFHHPLRYITVYSMFIYFVYLFYILRVPPLPISNQTLPHIISSMQTFDMLFFACHEFTSNVGKFFQASPFPHVAMIVRKGEHVFLWEADNHHDISRPGVDLIPLHTCLNQYPSNTLALQPLLIPPDLRKSATKKLYRIIHRHRNKHFKFNLIMFIMNTMKIGRFSDIPFTKTDQGFFCSELLATTYKQCGLMNNVFPDWLYSPGDFFHQRAYFKKSIRYGELIPFISK